MQVTVPSPGQATTIPSAPPPVGVTTPAVSEVAGAQIIVSPSGQVMIKLPGQPALPLQSQQVLANRRSTLSEQLNSATGRRDQLAQELRRAVDGADKAGIEARLKTLDDRIVNLEKQIAENGRLLEAAALMGVPQSTPRVRAPEPTVGPFTQKQATGLGFATIFFVLMPMALATTRLAWRRASRPSAPPGWSQAAPRLETLEQAVDTIAVEMERVSESQRYLTKVLTERSSASAGQWGQESFPLPEREPVPVRRSEG